MSKKRVQMVVDGDAVDMLQRMRTRTSAQSITHVILEALAVYASLAEIVETGRKLAAIDRTNNEFQELTIPSLQIRSPLVTGKLQALREAIQDGESTPVAEAYRLDKLFDDIGNR